MKELAGSTRQQENSNQENNFRRKPDVLMGYSLYIHVTILLIPNARCFNSTKRIEAVAIDVAAYALFLVNNRRT